jgi:hypothetical protein
MLHYCYADMTTINGIWVPKRPVFSFKKQPTGSYSNQNIALSFSGDEVVLLKCSRHISNILLCTLTITGIRYTF